MALRNALWARVGSQHRGGSERGSVVVRIGTWNLENLFRPGPAGPSTDAVYQAKLDKLAATITALAPDVLAVQEVGDPAALADLAARVGGGWHVETAGSGRARDPGRVAVAAGTRPGWSRCRCSRRVCARSRSTTPPWTRPRWAAPPCTPRSRSAAGPSMSSPPI